MIDTVLDFEHMISEDVQEEVKRLSEQIFDGVVKRTPVLKGDLRASWNLSKNTQDFSLVVGGSKESPLPPPIMPLLSFQQNEYPLVFISNGQPYAELIEHGYSKKAPAGMVQVTLDEMSWNMT